MATSTLYIESGDSISVESMDDPSKPDTTVIISAHNAHGEVQICLSAAQMVELVSQWEDECGEYGVNSKDADQSTKPKTWQEIKLFH